MRTVLLLVPLAVLAGEERVVPIEVPAAAANVDGKATAAAWPAGRLQLDAAVARLGVGGNRVALDPRLDPTVSADVEAVAGTWWQGVLVVATAFKLAPARGLAVPGKEGDEDAVSVRGGPVVLVRASDTVPTLRAAAGPLLLEWTRFDLKNREDVPGWTIDGLLSARVEPRLPREALVGAAIQQVRVSSAGAQIEVQTRSGSDGMSLTGDTSGQAKDTPEALTIELSVVVEESRRFTCSTPIRLGDRIRAVLPGELGEIDCRLLPGDRAAEAGNNVPAGKDPVLVTSFPKSTGLDRPSVRLLDGEKTLRPRGTGRSHNGERIIITSRFPGLAEGPFTVTLAGLLHDQPLTLPGRHDIAVGGISQAAGGARPAAPEHVAWPAGKVDLGTAVARWRLAEEVLLLDLGVDDRQVRDLPAYGGSAWPGLLAIAAAWDLAPAEATVGSTGPIRLAARNPATTWVACGPLLLSFTPQPAVTSQGLDGKRRMVPVAVGGRLPPSLPLDQLASHSFRWSEAVLPDGSIAAVQSDADSEDDEGQQAGAFRVQMAREGEAGPGPGPGITGAFTLGGIPAATRSVRLDGLFIGRFRQRWTSEVGLVGGAAAVTVADGRTIQVSAIDQSRLEESGMPRPGLAIIGLDESEEVAVAITAGDQPIEQGGSNTQRRGGQGQLAYYAPIEAGTAYRVVVSGKGAIREVWVPIAVELPLTR